MKKTIKSFIAIAAAIAALVSCAKEVSTPVEENEGKLIKLTLVASNPEAQPVTRTEMNGTKPYWSVGDAIGVSNGTSTNYEFTTSITAASATASFTGETEVSETLYAYYPYQDNGVSTKNNTTGALFDLPAEQNPTATSFDGAADVMVAKSFTVSEATTTVEDLEFARLGAIVKIVLKDNGSIMSNQHPSSVSMTAASPLAGRFVIDMQNQCLSSIYYNGSNIVTATYTSETQYEINNSNGAYVIVYPQTLANGTTLTIAAATEDYSISKTITLSKDIVLLPGKVNTLNISLTADNITSNASATPYALYSGDLSEGDYVIVYDGVAMKATVSGDRLGYSNVTVADNKIYDPAEDIVWHIAPSGDYWTIYNASVEKYAASTGAKNKAQLLDSGTDNKSLWAVTGESPYEFVNKQNTASNVNANLRYNAGYGFACYAASTGGALSLYKLSDTRLDSEMSWSSNSAAATITSTGITFNAPTLNLGHATSVTYSSSNESVATIASNGDVTIVGEGTTTISAAFAGNTTYKPATVSYTLTVTDERTACAAPTFTPGAGEVASGTTVTIASTTPGAVIYYTTGTSDFSAGDWTEYTAPVAITAACTIKAIATASNYKNSEVTSAAYTLEASPITIAEVLAASSGAKVKTTGIVAQKNQKGFILTDGNDNILVYQNAVPTVELGQAVTVAGTRGAYNNIAQITTPTITEGATGQTIPRTDLTIVTSANVTSFTTSVYVSLTGTLTISGTYYNISIANSSTQGSLYYLIGDEDFTAGDVSDLNGKGVTVFGYVTGRTNNYLNIAPVDVELDYTPALSISPATTSANPATWASGNGDAKTFTVTPTNGTWDYSSTNMDWATISKNGNVLTVTPKTAQASEAKTGTITVTLTPSQSGYSSISETIYLAQEEYVVGTEQVTLKYTGTTTTNMTGNNDAATVGLDAAKWSVVGAKGGASNFPGLNKDGTIRLYYHADGSNTITVTSSAGTINSIIVNYKASNANGKVLVDDNVVTASNGSYPINSSSFVITNGNTTNVQVHIESIVITYTPSN